MELDLSGETAIVTGAAQGVGKVIAEELAECGANVVVTDIKTEKGKEVAAELRDRGLSAKFVECDISSIDQTLALADATVEEFGSIDILVNNAGAFSEGSIRTMDPETWTDYMSVNINGQYYMINAVTPYMVEQQSGNIINIGSMVARSASTGHHASDYTVSQYGMIGLSKHMAWEFGGDNIRVNTILPGLVLTPINIERLPQEMHDERLRHTALNEFPYPVDIANGVKFLVSDWASKMTGKVLEIDSGSDIQTGPILDHIEIEEHPEKNKTFAEKD
jgi:3-oxoacyl-[acyl-carrier protein] reductase